MGKEYTSGLRTRIGSPRPPAPAAPAAAAEPPTTTAEAAAVVVMVAAAWRAVGEEVVVPESATEAVPSILRKPSTMAAGGVGLGFFCLGLYGMYVLICE